VRVPPQTRLLEKIGDVNGTPWIFPLILQPAQEHAGVGLDRTSVVHTKGALRDKTRQILTEFHQPALVQQFLPGREFNIGMVGGRRMRVMPLAEVDYSHLPGRIPPIMSYAAKFIETSEEYRKTRVICPAVVEPELAREITTTAMRAVRALGAWGYARVDIRLDDEGRPCVLDVNCNPSLEAEVALARSAEKAGIPYPDLLQMIVNAALEQQPYDAYVPMLGAFTTPALARAAAAKAR
jgi:D-alanine-D-alanine ligase